MARRRRGERLGLIVLLVTVGHIGLALHAQGSSQDYINGSVSTELKELSRRMADVEQSQRWLLYAISGGVIAQIIQIITGAGKRGGTEGERKAR